MTYLEIAQFAHQALKDQDLDLEAARSVLLEIARQAAKNLPTKKTELLKASCPDFNFGH